MIKKLVNELPKENFLVLDYIISHLKKTSAESEVTKMSVQNLAIVFGPTLFRSPDESATRILTDSPLLSGAVSNLIQHYEFIFKNGELLIEQEEEEEETSSERFDISKVDFTVLEQEYSGVSESSKFARRQNSFFEKRRKKLKTNVDVEDTEGEEGDLKGQIITDTVNEELKSDGVKISVESNLESTTNVEPEEEELQTRKSITYEQTDELEEKVTLEETETEFEERLSKVIVDLKDPQLGILERINMKRKREMRTDIFDQMSLEELKLEKHILKQELRYFEDLFYQMNGFEPTNEDKNTLRPVYHRYKTVKGRIDKFQRSNSLSTVHPSIGGSGVQTPTSLVEKRRRRTLNLTSSAIGTSSILEIKDEKYQEIKQEKRELQKKLLDFEKDFFEKNGRKVTKKSDREGMEEIYEKYSEIKIKLTAMEEAQK
jgi:hypothetical protein